MNVIRHDHIATYCDVEGLLGALGKKNERSVNLILCQEPLSFVRAERDEVKRTGCEESVQTWCSSSEIQLHCEIIRHVVDRQILLSRNFRHLTGHRPVATDYRAIVSSRSSSSFPSISKFMMH